MPAPPSSDAQNSRLQTSFTGDDLSIHQLRAAHDRRAVQQHLIEQVAQRLVEVHEAKYTVESQEMFMQAAADALRDGLGADAVYMLEWVSQDVAFRVRAGAGQTS